MLAVNFFFVAKYPNLGIGLDNATFPTVIKSQFTYIIKITAVVANSNRFEKEVLSLVYIETIFNFHAHMSTLR